MLRLFLVEPFFQKYVVPIFGLSSIQYTLVGDQLNPANTKCHGGQYMHGENNMKSI